MTITLDDFVFKNKIFPDVLKIDVEGSELSVIKGTKPCLKNYKPINFYRYIEVFLKKNA